MTVLLTQKKMKSKKFQIDDGDRGSAVPIEPFRVKEVPHRNKNTVKADINIEWQKR